MSNYREASVYLLSSEIVLILKTPHLFSESSKDYAIGKKCSFFIFLANVLRERKR